MHDSSTGSPQASPGQAPEDALILRDAPPSHHQHIRRYFDASYRVLLTSLEDLARDGTPTRPRKEAALRSMLDAVLDAKRRLQQE